MMIRLLPLLALEAAIAVAWWWFALNATVWGYAIVIGLCVALGPLNIAIYDTTTGGRR